jgi:hypothetical protein
MACPALLESFLVEQANLGRARISLAQECTIHREWASQVLHTMVISRITTLTLVQPHLTAFRTNEAHALILEIILQRRFIASSPPSLEGRSSIVARIQLRNLSAEVPFTHP